MPSKRTNDSVDRILEDLNIQQAQAGLRDSVTDRQVDEILRSVGITSAPAQPVPDRSPASGADGGLDALLQQLRGRLQGRPWVTVTWFVPDEKKAGGNCVTTTGQAMKLRGQPPALLLSEGEEIPLERMLALELIENPG